MSTQSFPIVLNKNNLVNGSSNTFTVNLPSNVDFSNINIGLAEVSMFYSWRSITSLYNNNKFQIEFPTAATTSTYSLTIPDGTYSVSDLNNYLKYYFISQNLYMTNNTTGDITVWGEFVENAPLYSVDYVAYPVPTSAPSGYTMATGFPTFPTTTRVPRLIVQNTEFGNLIGYVVGTFPSASTTLLTTINSSFVPTLDPVSSIYMLCDIVYNPYSSNSSVIHTFTAAGVGYGSLIESKPNEINYVRCQRTERNAITIRFVNQDYKPLNIVDTNLTVRLLLKEKSE
jgi:hypothetical protein